MLAKRNTPQKTIPYVARWAGPIHGHAINMTKSFYPKLAAFYEFDDLLQEAYLLFMKIKRTYPHVENRAHFMSLYSVSLRNRYIGLINTASRYNSIEDSPEADEPTCEQMYPALMLKAVPPRVRLLLKLWLEGSGKQAREAFKRLQQIYPEAV